MLRRKNQWAVTIAVRADAWVHANTPVPVLVRMDVKAASMNAQEVARTLVLALVDGRLSKTM